MQIHSDADLAGNALERSRIPPDPHGPTEPKGGASEPSSSFVAGRISVRCNYLKSPEVVAGRRRRLKSLLPHHSAPHRSPSEPLHSCKLCPHLPLNPPPPK